MATGANCGNSAFRMEFNIIYIMRTKVEAARLCGFDQNSVNHPGILLMAHSAQFFTLDEVNPIQDVVDRHLEAIRGYLEKQDHIIRWRKGTIADVRNRHAMMITFTVLCKTQSLPLVMTV